MAIGRKERAVCGAQCFNGNVRWCGTRSTWKCVLSAGVVQPTTYCGPSTLHKLVNHSVFSLLDYLLPRLAATAVQWRGGMLRGNGIASTLFQHAGAGI